MHTLANWCLSTTLSALFQMAGHALKNPTLLQADFNTLAAQTGGENAGFCFSYDEPLSHLIYAGCDFILVPSMFEPCGLTQVSCNCGPGVSPVR